MAFTNNRHTVKRFDSEIDSLIEQVLEMGRPVEQQVEQRGHGFSGMAISLAQAVVAGDEACSIAGIRTSTGLYAPAGPPSADQHRFAPGDVAAQSGQRSGADRRRGQESSLKKRWRFRLGAVGCTAELRMEMDLLATIASQRVQGGAR
jgi:hypothetical protein